jgi:hypothetical protein
MSPVRCIKLNHQVRYSWDFAIIRRTALTSAAYSGQNPAPIQFYIAADKLAVLGQYNNII